jgi:hypothetical protein
MPRHETFVRGYNTDSYRAAGNLYAYSDSRSWLAFGSGRRQQKSPRNGGWSEPGVEGAAIYSHSNRNPTGVACLRHHMLFEGQTWQCHRRHRSGLVQNPRPRWYGQVHVPTGSTGCADQSPRLLGFQRQHGRL